jgi:hypothetical protein
MKWRWVLLLFVIALPYLHFNGAHLVDLSFGSPPTGVALEYHYSRLLFEPLAGIAEYFFSHEDPKGLLKAWFLWTAVIPGLLALWWSRRLQRVLGAILISWLGFITLLALLIVLPLPTLYLKAPADWLRVDYHSHTWHSWDGIASPEQNLLFHKRLGYDCFFITEHEVTESYSEFSEEVRLHSAFPGVETVSADGIRFLILADRKFSMSEFNQRKANEIINKAHENGFLVIHTHSFTGQDWNYLANLGVDGFEIYDSADRGITHDEQVKLIRFCKERNLLMVSATDYHGWSTLSNVWTLVKIPSNVKPTAKMLLDLLRKRSETHVVVNLPSREYYGAGSYFEPFTATIHYFGGLSHLQSLSWAGWMLTFMFLHKVLGKRRLLQSITISLCLCFLGYSLSMGYCWYFIHPGSKIIGYPRAMVLALLACIWFIVWLFLYPLNKISIFNRFSFWKRHTTV